MPTVFTCAWCLVLSTGIREALPEVTAGPHPLVRGALVGDHALVYGQTELPRLAPAGGPPPRLELVKSLRWGCAAILRVGLVGGPPELFDLDCYSGGLRWPTRLGPAPLRWRVAGGVLYQAHYSSEGTNLGQGINKPRPVGEVGYPSVTLVGRPLTADLLAACRVVPGLEGQDRANARQAALDAAGAFEGLADLGPLDARFGKGFRADAVRRPEPELWRTHYDFHPLGKDQFELYISAPSGLAREHTKPPRYTAELPGWSRTSVHPPAWVGPFYVVADGDDRHFIVPGGRVFSLPADAQPGTALVKTWDADPVLALVHDADAGKSYAFTKSHYFPVTAKPAPKPHGLTAFPGATAEETLATVAKCGRVIRGLAP